MSKVVVVGREEGLTKLVVVRRKRMAKVVAVGREIGGDLVYRLFSPSYF